MERVIPVRPTLMKEYLRCPRRAHLRDTGWRPPIDWDREPLMWMGTAVHAGIAETMQAKKDGRANTVVTAYTSSLTHAWQEPPRVTPWTWERCLKLVGGGVTAALARYPLDAEHILAVEYETGAGKPDLIYRHAGGDTRVVDWKCHRRVPRELSAYDTDWQMWHYAWLCRDRGFGTPSCIEVVNILFEPRIEIIVHPVRLTDTALTDWAIEQAIPGWVEYGLREQEGRWPPRYTGCDMPFYPCEFKPHCHCGMRLEDGYAQRNKKEDT